MNNKERIINEKLISLSKSKFRSSFHLNNKMISYLNKYGFNKIKEHAISFVDERISDAFPDNDGKQTPMKGHPCFIAMHATGCCCRSCLEKWHNIPKGRSLTVNEKNYCVSLIMEWIIKEYKNNV